MNEAAIVAIVIALIGLAGAILGMLFRIWMGNKAIHILANTNFVRMTRDLRFALIGMFILIMASIYATYKAIARLRTPPQ